MEGRVRNNRSLFCSEFPSKLSIFRSILPVLIEPVVDLGLGVKRVAKVGGSGGGNPEFVLIIAEQVVDQLLVLSLVVLLDDAEVSEGLAYMLRKKTLG